MKAYRSAANTTRGGEHDDADLRLFRPELNMQRLKGSMKRLAMPGADFDSGELIQCIGALVRLGECSPSRATRRGAAEQPQ